MESEQSTSGDWSPEARWLVDWSVDDLSIRVEVVEYLALAGPPREVWNAEIISVPQSDRVDFETMAQLTSALTMGNGVPANHAIDYRKGFTEWGASGAGQWILLQVSDMILDGVVGAVAYEALKATVSELAGRGRARADWEPEPLTAEEAVARAESHLGEAYDLFDENYRFQGELVGEEVRSDGSRIVRFAVGDRRYEVELVDDSGLVMIARSGWTAQS